MIRGRLVLGNVLVVAACALVYELTTAALASYVLGDAVRQFSITLGLYLAAMGVGAYASKIVGSSVAEAYLAIELGLAIVGGLSAPLLFRISESGSAFHVVVYATIFVIGLLVGFELPLLMRMLEGESTASDLVSRSLAWDNAGALIAALLFPMVMVPLLGLVRTSVITGLVNAGIAISGTWVLRESLSSRHAFLLRGAGGIVAAALIFSFARAPVWVLAWAE
ncbi:MAG: hypothetical protein ABI461_18365 [Polyangiaceae bacterium]